MRTYGDRCGIARALDMVGERWALLVVRELLLGPKRFTDLRAGLPQVGPDVLAQRLRELERAGIVQRATLPPPAASRVYELTERGRELEEVVLALGRWGSRAPVRAQDAAFGPDSAVLALKTMFDPATAGGLAATYELRLGDQVFTLRVADGELEAARSAPADADATLATDPRTLTAVLWHGLAVEDAIAAGRLELGGSRRLLNRLLRLFAQPASETVSASVS